MFIHYCSFSELLERIRTRQPVEELVTWLISSSQHSDVAEATDNYKFWRSVAASHALLAASQQDIVGTQIGIERYSTLLKEGENTKLNHCYILMYQIFHF